jgi:hypothetical protein
MEFLSPSWLYLLGIAAPVIALYLFRPKRRERKLPTTLFWRQVLKERSERPSIKRLRQLLSLLLLLLFLLLLAFAASKPLWQDKENSGRDAVIVLDTSASMGVMEGPRSRLELAKEQARDILQALPAGAQAALISLGPTPRIVVPKTQDVPLLLRGLDSLTEPSGASRFRPALELAADLANGQKPPATVYLISDGGGLPESEAQELSAPVVFVPVGEAQENLGITHFVIRRHPSADREYEVLLTVHNDTSRNAAAKVELYLDGNLLNAIPITVEAKGDHTEVLSQAFPTGGALEARLVNQSRDARDLLAEDNRAFAFVPERPKAQVALVSSSGAYFLKTALLSNPGIDAFSVTPLEWPGVDEREYDLVIFHRFLPPKLPGIPYLIFDGEPGPGTPMGPASGPSSGPSSAPAGLPSGTLEGVAHGPVEVVGEDAAPKVGVVDYRHPLLDHVGLEGITIAEARIVGRPDWGKVVVSGERGPLLIAGEKEGVRAVYCAFDPNDSDFPFRVGFLNLLANAVNWLWGPGASPADYVVRPGDRVPEALLVGDIDALTVRRAEEGAPDSPARRFRAVQPGVYEVRTGGESVGVFVVSLAEARESRVSPIQALGLGEKPFQALSGTLAALGRDLWWPLALLGLLLVALEWFLYRRRVVQ